MNDATITLIGNVATSVRFARSDKGNAFASFRMACTPRRFDRMSGQWIDERTTFVSVSCFRALAENVVTSLTKGDPIVVTGKLRVTPWERDDRSGISVEVDAASVGHDLNRGQTRFARLRKEFTGEPDAENPDIAVARTPENTAPVESEAPAAEPVADDGGVSTFDDTRVAA